MIKYPAMIGEKLEIPHINMLIGPRPAKNNDKYSSKYRYRGILYSFISYLFYFLNGGFLSATTNECKNKGDNKAGKADNLGHEYK